MLDPLRRGHPCLLSGSGTPAVLTVPATTLRLLRSAAFWSCWFTLLSAWLLQSRHHIPFHMSCHLLSPVIVSMTAGLDIFTTSTTVRSAVLVTLAGSLAVLVPFPQNQTGFGAVTQ